LAVGEYMKTAELPQEIMLLSDLKEHTKNPNKHPESQINKIRHAIKTHGYYAVTITIQKSTKTIIKGHGVREALLAEGYDKALVNVKDCDDNEALAILIADNKLQSDSIIDNASLQQVINELSELNIPALDFGFDPKDLEDLASQILADSGGYQADEKDDVIPEVKEAITKTGDIWHLSNHRVMCGDSTLKSDVDKLMGGVKADMGFNDPPYGMKKENEGIANDNLNYADLLEFNKKWIALQFQHIKDNGSFYCWGTDEPLMDIYHEIIKPYIKTQKATFRNLITWDKGVGQGQMSEDYRMYPIADEKCLFIMMGVQGFNNNADNYFEGWTPIVEYLENSRQQMGWSIKDTKRIAGHSEKSGCHWFDKSQWMMPTEETYKRWQEASNNDAFKKEYDAFKKEYDELKKEYDELKKEYYSTRAYFDNVHDNQNNVWHFARATGNKEHATPKPVELCSRAILSSCQEDGIVSDLFLGSGSTLIACEKLNRVCYGMEISPLYCDVIVKRYIDFVGTDKDVFVDRDGQKIAFSEVGN
jgi:DNA modification methylase